MAGGLGPVLVLSCYLFTNNTAKTLPFSKNVRFLAAMTEYIKELNTSYIIGADWNMEPNVLSSTGIISAIEGRIMHGQLPFLRI